MYKIGEHVFLIDRNNVSRGRICAIKAAENEETAYQVDCIDDYYYNIKESCIFLTEEEFTKTLLYYLRG